MRTGSALLRSLGLVVVYWVHGIALVSGQTVSDGTGSDQKNSASPAKSPKGEVHRTSIDPESPPRNPPSRPASAGVERKGEAEGRADRPVEDEADRLPTATLADVEVAEATGPTSIRSAPVSAALTPSSPRPKTTPTALRGGESVSSIAGSSETGTLARPPEPEENASEENIPQELQRRAEKPAPSQAARGGHLVDRWEIPETLSPGMHEVEWPEWLFSGADLYVDEPPPYAEIATLPLFYVYPPRETELKRKMKKLVRKKIFREIRRHVKRRWRKLFKGDPTMRFSTYEETLAKINHIGKGGDRVDEFNDDYRTNEAKDQVFRRESRRGEPEIPLFTWGPLTVTDSGSLRFDMGTAAATEGDDIVVVEKVDVGENNAKPLFSGREYKLHTSLNVSVNDDFDAGRNYVPFLSSYGADIEVEWLSDILGREMVGAEFEVEFDDDGDVAAFFNFVIKSR